LWRHFDLCLSTSIDFKTKLYSPLNCDISQQQTQQGVNRTASMASKAKQQSQQQHGYEFGGP